MVSILPNSLQLISITSKLKHSVRSINSTPIIAMAVKRKSVAQNAGGAKKAKAAIEYAAATQPGIPQITPLSKLLESMQLHHVKVQPGKGNVVHWFRSDLRLEDNRALHAASQKAKAEGKYVIALYVVSPQVPTSSSVYRG
jgi:hypothetical protein